ncbi:hypothetical protein NCAS_0I02490 [Naumovozyma castellii]|uniref:Uncharacterized protein n=1 Tax=Naumovozyma castellii TaxID=27288 RepID=G0VK83_NAUCA|nr:hypothetical protein NCAS_0I02490 [Naumovozyma castellii CBS 4309]CCC71917.1 hypothetical protein NCAS_0I02490 [Naumovozyma castellii CBS 4309]
MEKLKELEEKRQRLKELREKRSKFPQTPIRRYNGISSRTNSESRIPLRYNEVLHKNKAVETVSVAVQTDESFELTRHSNHLSEILHDDKPKIITYSKGIQTDNYESDKEEIQEPIRQEEKRVLEEEEEEEEDSNNKLEGKVVEEDHPKIQFLEPLLITTEANTLVTNKSFAREKNYSNIRPSLKGQSKNTSCKLLDNWTLDIEANENMKLFCVSIDYFQGLILISYRRTPINPLDIKETNWSFVEVIQREGMVVIDRLTFRGQSLIGGHFLGKYCREDGVDEGKYIVSILLRTLNGKTILYELRAVKDKQDKKKYERNLIIRNYHNAPVFGIDEIKADNIINARIVSGSNNGIINELNCMNLSFYEDPTMVHRSSTRGRIHQTRIVPPKYTELIALQEKIQDQSGDDQDETDDIVRGDQLFCDHLDKVVLNEEICITSLTVAPNNSDCVYLGAEDGGIYKVLLSRTNMDDNNKLPISLNNNGFLPRVNFHSSDVTSLRFHPQNDDLLCSGSMDWNCHLWDTFNNDLIDSIDLKEDVIAVQWLPDRDTYRCCVLTMYNFCIVEWSLTREDSKWVSQAPPSITHTISSEELGQKMFTSFHLYDHEGLMVLVLGGSSGTISFLELAARR